MKIDFAAWRSRLTSGRFADWALYAALFLLPWQTRWIIRAGDLNGAWEYGTISLFAVDLIILFALACRLLSSDRPPLSLRGIIYRYCLVGFFAYLILALPFSLSPALSAFRLAVLFLAVALIYLLSTSRAPFLNNCFAFLVGAASSSLLGIWQFISQSSAASTWLGLAFHDPAGLGTSVIEATAPDGFIERWLRAYGSLDHPNMLGGLAAVALVLTVWLWLYHRGGKHPRRDSLLAFFLVIFTAAATLSFSRAAWLAAGIGIAVTAIGYLFKRHWKELAVAGGIIILVAGLIVSQYAYLFAPRLQADTRLEQISTTERLAGYGTSAGIISRQPVQGAGLGAYGLELHRSIDNKQPGWFYQPVHNAFVLITAETGLIGFGFVIASLGAYLIFIYRRAPDSRSRLLIISLAAAGLTLALFDHWLFSLHFGLLLTGAALGLLGSETRAEL